MTVESSVVVSSAPPGGFHATTRTSGQILAEARERFEPAYRAAVEALPTELGRIAGYHAGWWDSQGRSCARSGKAVRPALTLACARAAGGEGGLGARRVVAAAVVVEMVHDFTLLHDDVMDGDRMRRHRPAAWTQFGTGPAILTGDSLLVLAVDLALDTVGSAAAKALSEALLELCRGQSADLALESRCEVTLATCLQMAERKTGAVLGAACQLGALAAGLAMEASLAYRRFGRQLGVAFQLADDLLGIWGDPARTGKPVFADLAARKKSLPVAAALASGTPAGRRLAQLYRTGNTLTEPDLDEAAELIERAGGRAWAQAEADQRLRRAHEALAQAHPTPEGSADLQILAASLTRRDH